MSVELQNLLSGARPPGIYRLTLRGGRAGIAALAGQRGWQFFHLDARQIASKGDFLRACAQTLGFPSYFGNNWDALEDSLRDLAWAPAEHGYLVLIDAAGHFAAAAPGDFRVALDILRTAVDYWRSTPTPMAVLLRGAGRSVRDVPKLE
jgi:hypothetical protein